MSDARQIEKINQSDDHEAEWLDFPASPVPADSIEALLRNKSVPVAPTLRSGAGRPAK